MQESPFDNLMQTEDPWSSLFETLSQPKQTALTPEAVNRQAALGGFALSTEPLLSSIRERSEYARGMLEIGEDAKLRAEALAKRVQEFNEFAVESLSRAGATQEQADILAAQVARRRSQDLEESIIEERVVEKARELAAAGDPVQAAVIAQSYEEGSAIEQHNNYMTKVMMARRWADQFELDKDRAGVAGAVADFVSSMFVWNPERNVGNVTSPFVQERMWDFLFSGQRAGSEQQAFNRNIEDMSISEFNDWLGSMTQKLQDQTDIPFFGSNRSDMARLSEQLAGSSPVDQGMINVWDGLEAALTFIPFGAAGDAAKTARPLLRPKRPLDILANAGAREEAGQIAAATLKGVEIPGITPDDAVDALLPAAIKPSPEGGVTLQNATKRQLETLDELSKLPEARRLDAAEALEAFDAAKSEIGKRLNRPLVDVQRVRTPVALGESVDELVYIYGKTNGKGWASKANAQENLGLYGTPMGDVFKDPASGQWFIKARLPIPETGHYTRKLDPNVKGPVQYYTLSADARADKNLAGDLHTAADRQRKVNQIYKERFEKDFTRLGKKDLEAFEQVRLKGQEGDGQWFDRDRFQQLFVDNGGNPKKQEEAWRTYQAYKEFEDLDWFIESIYEFTNRSARGFQRVILPESNRGFGNDVDAIIDYGLSRAPKDTEIYDMSEGVWIRDSSRLQETGDYVGLKFAEPRQLPDGALVDYAFIKAGDFETAALQPYGVAYRPGGRRFYQAGLKFAKQARRGEVGRLKQEEWLNPKTFAAGTERELRDLINWIESMRVPMSKFKTNEEAEQWLRANFKPRGNFDVDWFLENINRKFPVEIVDDRRLPSQYEALDPSKRRFLSDKEPEAENLYHRRYSDRRGEALRDYMGKTAPTLSFQEEVNRSFAEISKAVGMNNFRVQATERWIETYLKHVDQTFPENMSPYQKMQSANLETIKTKQGVPNEAVANEIFWRAHNDRETIRRMIGWMSDEDKMWNRVNERVVSIVDDKFKNSNYTEVARKLVNSNPVQFMRYVASSLVFGFFNISHFFLNIGTAAAAVTISPRRGALATLAYPLVRFMALRSDVGEGFYKGIASKYKQFGFNSSEDFVEYLKYTKNSGWNFIDGSHAMINDYGANAGIDSFSSKARKASDTMMFFFQEGELMNSIIGQNMAWREVRDQLPNLKIGSSEFNAEVARRASKYTFNMRAESNAVWQRGVASIPTQFWSYPTRFLEAYIGDAAKGGLTDAQKMRLFAGQFILFGTAGVPLADGIKELYFQNTGENLELGTAGSLVTRGLIDNLIYATTGADSLVSARYGTGNWFGELYKALFNVSSFGPTSPAEFLGGATTSIWGKAAGNVYEVLKYAAIENPLMGPADEAGLEGMPLTRKAVMDALTSITSVSNGLKAYMIMNYGILRSNNGLIIASDVPEEAAVFQMLLGAQPGVQETLTAQRAYLRDRESDVKKIRDILRSIDQEAMQTGNWEEANQKRAVIMRTLPDRLRQDVYNLRAPDHESVADYYAERTEEALRKDEISENAAN